MAKFTELNRFHLFYRPDHRGRVIQYPPTACDPLGPQFFVECAKHLIMVEVRKAELSELNAAIDAAFDDCPNCKDEREAAATRFPEGAEL